VSGTINSIYVKEWQEVYAGQKLASISDQYSKYYLDLQKAEIDYEKQIINKESQTLSLDKKIIDAEISLDDAKNNLENAKITAAEDLKKAELDRWNSNIIDTNSQSYLELEKAKLDYQNTLDSNKQQLETYVNNVQKEYNNLSLALWDVIKFSDEILGVTVDNKDKNDEFDSFLWAKSLWTKNEAKTALLDLIQTNTKHNNISISIINENNMVDIMDDFTQWYDKIKVLLQKMEIVINSSISSVGSLSEDDLNNYLSKINSFQSSNQNNLSSFISTRNSIVSFLNTYENKELSSFKNVELQEKKLSDSSVSWEANYQKSIVNINNTLYTHESKLKQAQASYDNAVKNKEITIKSLDNIIESARNSVQKSSVEYAKLTLISPISGVVSGLQVDMGSDVWNGTQVMSIVWNANTQIQVSLNSNQIWTIEEGQEVIVEYQGKQIPGLVYSRSLVAGDNLEYRVTIHIKEKISLIWGSTKVLFPQTAMGTYLPLSIITIEENNKWFLYYFEDETAKKMYVDLGKINGDRVEILSAIPKDTSIITTDLKKYNSKIQKLSINSKNTWTNQ